MKKKLGALILLVSLMWVGVSYADDFLGAPVIPGGKVLLSTNDRLEKTYDMKYKDAVQFYKDAMAKEEFVKFWDRGDSTYIEHHLNRLWHSITIEKGDQGKTTIVWVRDNWTWIIGMLVLRFIGVFAVLFVLYVVLEISGAFFARTAGEAK